jgi:hypothetical protein
VAKAIRRLNPVIWSRKRREQAVICTLPHVLGYAAEHWIEEGRRGTVEVSAAEYALIPQRVREQHAAEGLKYVGPFCSWDALLRFAESQAAVGPLTYAVPASQEKLSVSMSVTADRRLAVRFAAAPDTQWSIEGLVTNWQRLVAIPSRRRSHK